MNDFFLTIYHQINNTGDLSELFFALPIIVIIGLIYWILRQVYLKRKLTINVDKSQIKPVNELLRLLLLLWYVSLCFMTLLPSGFWRAIWIACIFGSNIFQEMSTIKFSGWTLVPDIISYSTEGHFNWFLASLRFKITDYIENVLLFVPLGAVLPFIYKNQTFLKVLLTGACTSFFIEFLQGFMGRDGDVDDLICNTLGTAIGFFLYLLLKKLLSKFTDK